MPLQRQDTREHAGQAAYEGDVTARPTYHDGTRRRTWAELSNIARESWRMNPTPRYT